MSTIDEGVVVDAEPIEPSAGQEVIQALADAFGLDGRRIVHFSVVWDIGRPVSVSTVEQLTDSAGKALAGKFKAIDWIPKE